MFIIDTEYNNNGVKIQSANQKRDNYMREKLKSNILLTYLKINTLFILPIILFSTNPVLFNNFPILGIYAALMLLYYLCKLPYVHIILSVILFIYYIIYYIKNDTDKNDTDKKNKRLTFVYIIINIVVNICWSIIGRFFAVQ